MKTLTIQFPRKWGYFIIKLCMLIIINPFNFYGNLLSFSITFSKKRCRPKKAMITQHVNRTPAGAFSWGEAESRPNPALSSLKMKDDNAHLVFPPSSLIWLNEIQCHVFGGALTNEFFFLRDLFRVFLLIGFF